MGDYEMLMGVLLAVWAAVPVVVVVLVAIVLRRTNPRAIRDVRSRLEALEAGQGRSEQALREELTNNRREISGSAKEAREESSRAMTQFRDSMLGTLGDLSRTQTDQLSALTTSNENKLEQMRQTVERQLRELQSDNTKKLDEMRKTVDEKLQGTLEKRLSESFRMVSDRLEQVHKGLGEMQNLASGVGDLKRVLTNVKIRGTWGEIQLESLLEQILTPEQYEKNVATKTGSAERVEFCVRLPGRGDGERDIVWLPIDAKFPNEDYQRLVEAQERADATAQAEAIKQLEVRIRSAAKDIRDKYVDPPNTTDFAILFLPTEGLYAEVIRRTDLVDALQRQYRIVIAGPTTLAALLNSLQMGFRTLAIERRSSEVWTLLASVKNEFGRFGDIITKVQKKLQEASNVMDTAASKSRTIERKLRNVQDLPSPDVPQIAEVVEIAPGTDPDGDTAESAPEKDASAHS